MPNRGLEPTTLRSRGTCSTDCVSRAPHSFVFVPQVFPPDEIEQVSNKDDMKTSLKKVVKEVGIWGRRGTGPGGESDCFSLPSWTGH